MRSECGSSGSASRSSVMTPNASSTSATVAASGPECSSDQHKMGTPSVGTRPNVPLIPTTPLCAAGMRTDPPPSLPSAMGTRPMPTDAPEPVEEPPVSRSGS
jgi:hypothetical protein